MRKKRLLVNWKVKEKNTEKKQIEHITNEKRKLIRNIIKEIFPKLKKLTSLMSNGLLKSKANGNRKQAAILLLKHSSSKMH